MQGSAQMRSNKNRFVQTEFQKSTHSFNYQKLNYFAVVCKYLPDECE